MAISASFSYEKQTHVVDGVPMASVGVGDGDPIVTASADWLATTDIPKLLVVADPGAILVDAQLEFCRGLSNQREVSVPGSHFRQEDRPDEIGAAIAAWLGDRREAS